MLKTVGILLLAFLLASCAGRPDFDVRTQTVSYKDLVKVDAPKGDPIIIAVYDFNDMTGQKKPSDSIASMSTAVTQGSYQILIKALQDAGNGKWFRVVERASLPSLLQERKLIRSTRQQVNGEGAEPLPPLLFAGAYITGGIVGYDSNTKTGGLGARVLGIQAHKQWRQDVITIVLRLVNVQTGEVVITTTVEKTIISAETGGDVFKYFDTDTMLVEIEAGVARNEPVTFAVRKAIEKGVLDLINEGAKKKLWEFEPVKEDIMLDVSELDEKVEKKNSIKIVEEEKVEKTYEEYLLQKEMMKDARKKKIQEELKAEQEKKIEEEKSDEKNSNVDGDSSSDNN
tara:strand:+ start:515 stop:1540 length:1026 start_codon:yes stop_codon:yes gene_type:complete